MTTLLFSNLTIELHLLEIEPGGYCSEHLHTAKTNHFFVISGELEILRWPAGESGIPDLTILRAGDSTVLRPGTWHKFKANEKTVCLELYEAVLSEDILRRSVGGLR